MVQMTSGAEGSIPADVIAPKTTYTSFAQEAVTRLRSAKEGQRATFKTEQGEHRYVVTKVAVGSDMPYTAFLSSAHEQGIIPQGEMLVVNILTPSDELFQIGVNVDGSRATVGYARDVVHQDLSYTPRSPGVLAQDLGLDGSSTFVALKQTTSGGWDIDQAVEFPDPQYASRDGTKSLEKTNPHVADMLSRVQGYLKQVK